MQWFHLMMAGAFSLAIAASWKYPRHRLWALVLTGAWLASEAYLFMPKPQYLGDVFFGPWGSQSLFNAGVNLFVCVLIICIAKMKWEGVLFTTTMIAMILALIQIVGVTLPQRYYGIFLEALNYFNLLTIGGAIYMESNRGYSMADRYSTSDIWGGLLGRVSGIGLVIRKFLQAPWQPSKRWE